MESTTKAQLELINQQIKELAGIYQEVVGRMDISVNEFWIWYSLMIIEEECSQQDICNAWSLSKQTVNTIVMHMVQAGYAVLRVVPGTRNRKMICLTEEGRAYGERIVFPVFLAEKRAFERLSQADRSAMTGVMAKYIEALKAEIGKE